MPIMSLQGRSASVFSSTTQPSPTAESRPHKANPLRWVFEFLPPIFDARAPCPCGRSLICTKQSSSWKLSRVFWLAKAELSCSRGGGQSGRTHCGIHDLGDNFSKLQWHTLFHACRMRLNFLSLHVCSRAEAHANHQRNRTRIFTLPRRACTPRACRAFGGAELRR